MSEEERIAEPKPAKKSFGWPFWLLLTVSIVIFFGFAQTSNKRRGKLVETREAISNLRQIGIALYEFEIKYGSYPSEATATLVTENHPKHGHNLKGRSSNTLFRQLIAAGYVKSEQIFYAKILGVRKPDGDISSGKELEKGEVAFAYVAGLSTEGNPARIVAFCPIIPGTDRFDPKPFDGKAVVLRVDTSVNIVNIDKNGHALVGGKNMLSPDHPIWDGKVIDIRYPE
jgi:hypothetical protein